MGRGARAAIALTAVAGAAAVLSLGQASADLLRSTSTSVSCDAVRLIGQTATCTATVADTDMGPATTPTGVVEFSATGIHRFAERGVCTLSAGSCQVTYRGDGLGIETITAVYHGDSTHAGSSGTQQAIITAPIGPGPLPHCHVPNVKGKTLAAAKTSLRRSFCRTGTIGRAFSRRIEKGHVISVRPGRGKLLPYGAQVRLLVSKGRHQGRL